MNLAVAADMKSTDVLSSLKEHIKSNPGVKVRELLGHLKQLPLKVHSTEHGINDAAIRSFLESHFKVFLIDSNDCVFVRPPAPTETELPPTDNLTTLHGAKGRISYVSSVYGFIAVDHPFKTSVYFDIQHFENKSWKDLLSAGLREGDRVVVDGCKTFGHKAQFKATQVDRLTEASLPANKDGHLHNQSGVIDRVRPGYGFIAFGCGHRNSAFFCGRVVDKSMMTKNDQNLTHIFTVGDKVRFDAEPDKKRCNRAKWKATKVWCNQGVVGLHGTPDSEEENGEEVFMSDDDDEDEAEELLSQRTQQVRRHSDVEECPAGRPDWEEHQEAFQEPQNSVQSGLEDFVKRASGTRCSASAPACNSKRPSAQAANASSLKQVKRGKPTLQTSSAAQMSEAAPSTRRAAGQKGRASADGQRDFHRSGAEVDTGALATDGSSAEEAPVSIYPEVKGTIVRVLECIARVRVREGEVFREIEFTVDCFYRNGEVVLDDLNEVLKEGDEVTLEYMVGRSARKGEVVHCDLLWQGAKPQTAPRLSPDEFLKRLDNAGELARYAVAY